MIKNVIYVIFLILSIMVTVKVKSQCRVSDLPVEDTIALNKIWVNLRNAVLNKNKLAMSSFFEFPFYCAPIIKGSKDSATVLVTKKTFLQRYHEILLSQNFIDLIGKRQISEVLIGDLQDDCSCSYSINFPLSKASKKSEGLQVFITFKKVKTKYKIVSIWTVP